MKFSSDFIILPLKTSPCIYTMGMTYFLKYLIIVGYFIWIMYYCNSEKSKEVHER